MFKIDADSCRKWVSSAVETIRKLLHILHLFLYRFSQVLKRELASKQVRKICRISRDLLCMDIELS